METALLASFFVVAARVLFQIRRMNIKRLQEHGATPLTTLYYQKFALWPSLILLVLTFRSEYIPILLSKEILVAVCIIFFFWITQEALNFFLINSAQNLSFLKAFETIVAIPISLSLGYLINHDVPNIWIFLAMFFLFVAVFVQPQNTSQKGIKMFQAGFLLILSLAVVSILLDETNGALYRFLLQNLEATFFGIGVYTFLAMAGLNIFFLFKRIPTSQKKIARTYPYWAFSIAPLWFLASIPEGFGLFSVPIFTYMGISAVSFLMDVFSDFKNQRIRSTPKTFLFIGLTLLGIGFSVFSLV